MLVFFPRIAVALVAGELEVFITLSLERSAARLGDTVWSLLQRFL